MCTEFFPVSQSLVGTHPFWSDMYKSLRLLYGRNVLTDGRTHSTDEDMFSFLCQCEDNHFLDFVELIFQSDHIWGRSWTSRPGFIVREEFVEHVNRFFELDSLPFALTDFVFPPAPQWESGSRLFLGSDYPPRVEAHPQVIDRDNEVLHNYAIEPTLDVLTQPHFKNANKEFRDALEDYRKGRFGDCVTKCGSSFESVMKVICYRRGWQYQQTDTASPLLATILSQTNLPEFFNQPIMLIATVRNRLSSSHGSGTQERVVPKHIARFVINSTASAILLTVDETKQ